jgi:transcriptional regulator with XRE-family HTH domain
MSPFRTVRPSSAATRARVDAIHAAAGGEVRAARRRRRWSCDRLADEAGVSRTLVYLVERGEPTTLETYARLGAALGLRVELTFGDPRAKDRPARAQDPVHAAIVEMLAARYAAQGRIVAVDDPFQHYQFAGRADLAVVDPAGPDLLHHEVKTAIPNVGELAGAWNTKRQYLAGVLADRLGFGRGFRSITHVLTIAWTAECLHLVRLREATIRALGPDTADAFDAWWGGGRPPAPGTTSSVILLDPIDRPRAPAWVGLEDARTIRPRHAGYAALLDALGRAGRA